MDAPTPLLTHSLSSPRAGLFGTLVHRPVTLLVVFAALLVLGLISYSRIPVQMMPNGIVEPGLQIYVSHPGASASENEEKVTRVLEEQMRTLAGVEDIYSNSRDDSLWVQVTFDANTDMDLAKAEVRDRIERARPQLPETVQEIGIWSWSNDEMPVMFFAMLHPGDSKRTDFLVDNVIKRKLEAVDGVGRIEIWGVLDDSVRILLDEDRVRAANLDLGSLIGRLMRDNFAMPMGEVTDGERRIMLRSDMRFGSLEEIAAYPVGEGLVIADLGEVVEAKSVRNRLFRIDGSYSFYGEIQKDSQANVVATCRRVTQAIEELEKDPRLNGEFKFLALFNQGRFIESSLGQLKETAMWGGGLAVLVLFVFLRRVRTTLCVALSIPISVLLAISWIYFGGGTFNVLTMTGVTLAMGMLVDNSVVVIENIARLRGLGMSSRRAAVEGTREVGLAVLLATLTSVVVFMPLIFMTENPMLRIMFGELGMPLCLALLFSLFVALVFLPVAAARVVGDRPLAVERLARVLGPAARAPARLLALGIGGLRALFNLGLRAGHRLNRAVLAIVSPLRWILGLALVGLAVWQAREVLPVMKLAQRAQEFGLVTPLALGGVQLAFAGIALLLGLALLLFALPWLRRRPSAGPARPASLLPRGDSALDFLVEGNRALVGWSLQHRLLASLFACGAVVSVVAPCSQMNVAAFGEEDNTSRIDLSVDLEENFTLEEAEQEMLFYEDFFAARLDDYGYEHIANRFDASGGRVTLYWEDSVPVERFEAIRKEIREELVPPPGHEFLMRGDEGENSRNRNLVTFRLTGPDSEELALYGERAIKILEKVPGLHSISSPLEDAPGQVSVRLDSDLAQSFGVSPESALQSISWALRGWQLPRYQEEGREVPLIIEYDDEELAGLSTLRELDIFNGQNSVPLTSFAELEFGRGSRSIQRRNGKVSFTILGRVDNPLQQREVSEAGYRALQQLDMPRGYAVGEEDLVGRRQDEEMGEMRYALMLSVVLVFLLMGILFESFVLPFSVLFTIPFAVVGGVWTLWLTGTTMDSVGYIGFIILVGVVVNNGIVLVDRIHNLRGLGQERTKAVIDGCATRVRPIVMTALTTVIGLVPMALSEPAREGIDYRALATCVAGGLTASTVFTLWVVPLAYTLIDDLRMAVARNVSWAVRPPKGEAAEVEPA